MRFFYADPGLRSHVGHHATTCRAVVNELRRRHVKTLVFGYHDLMPELCDELGATPHFTYRPYDLTDGDPISGWLDAFEAGSKRIGEELGRLPELGAGDVLFINTVMPSTLMGLALWLAAISPSRWPQIVLEIGTDSGLDATPTGSGYAMSTRDPRVDPRAILYRFAAKHIPSAASRHLHLFYVDKYNADIFSHLLGRTVHLLPSFHHAFGRLRNRVGTRPITVAVLGHQQPAKGYHLIPEIAPKLLSRGDCRVIAHNAGTQPEVQQQMRALAALDSRLILNERILNDSEWASLIQTADVVLCPYEPSHYRVMPSGMASEAVANGIPIVGPAATSIEHLIKAYEGCGVVFSRQDVASIVEATDQLLNKFDHYAALALGAAEKWARANGPDKALDVIMRHASL